MQRDAKYAMVANMQICSKGPHCIILSTCDTCPKFQLGIVKVLLGV